MKYRISLLAILLLLSGLAFTKTERATSDVFLIGLESTTLQPLLLPRPKPSSKLKMPDTRGPGASINTGTGSGTIGFIGGSDGAGNIRGYATATCTSAQNVTRSPISAGSFDFDDNQEFFFGQIALATLMNNDPTVACAQIGLYEDSSKTNGVEFLLQNLTCNGTTCNGNTADVCVNTTAGSWTSDAPNC
ncbi:MAG: hypothetical protein NXI01_01425 [Gammaproteobacteria bacterium]|nr:hypothetical protein [Gammaproteobacteria bacterium]